MECLIFVILTESLGLDIETRLASQTWCVVVSAFWLRSVSSKSGDPYNLAFNRLACCGLISSLDVGKSSDQVREACC